MASQGDPASRMASARTLSFFRSQESLSEPSRLPALSEPDEEEGTYSAAATTQFDIPRSTHVSSTGANSSASSYIANVPGRSPTAFHFEDHLSVPTGLSSRRDTRDTRDLRDNGRISPLSSVLGIFPNRHSQPYLSNLYAGPLGEMNNDTPREPSPVADNCPTESENSPRKVQHDASMYGSRRKDFKTGSKTKQFWAKQSRNHLVAGVGEILGTAMFLFFGFASILVANASAEDDRLNESTSPQIIRYLFISLGFGLAFAVNIWIFARISGAMLNPAITLAMALVQEISVMRAVVCFIAQIAGGLIASGLVMLLFPGPFDIVRTRLNHGTSLAQGVFLEALMTAELVTTVLMLTKERCRRNLAAPIAIGSAVFLGHLIGMPFTGVGMNPVRSFAPDVVTATFNSDHWVYWIGPLIGSLLAACLYKLSSLLKDDDEHATHPRSDHIV